MSHGGRCVRSCLGEVADGQGDSARRYGLVRFGNRCARGDGPVGAVDPLVGGIQLLSGDGISTGRTQGTVTHTIEIARLPILVADGQDATGVLATDADGAVGIRGLNQLGVGKRLICRRLCRICHALHSRYRVFYTLQLATVDRVIAVRVHDTIVHVDDTPLDFCITNRNRLCFACHGVSTDGDGAVGRCARSVADCNAVMGGARLPTQGDRSRPAFGTRKRVTANGNL